MKTKTSWKTTSTGVKKMWHPTTDDEAVPEVAMMLTEAEEAAKAVRWVVEKEDSVDPPSARQLRYEVINEFEGRVFREVVWPCPGAG